VNDGLSDSGLLRVSIFVEANGGKPGCGGHWLGWCERCFVATLPDAKRRSRPVAVVRPSSNSTAAGKGTTAIRSIALARSHRPEQSLE
jgi:hypothetical protein